jgi:hypothetical protein
LQCLRLIVFLWLSMVVELFLCPEMLKSTKSFGFFDYKIRTIPTLEPYVVFKDNSFALDFAHLLKINSTLIFHSGTCILGISGFEKLKCLFVVYTVLSFICLTVYYK